MNRIRKGDEVIVIAGRDKGKRGNVLRVMTDGRLVVADINMVKRHTKPRPATNAAEAAVLIGPGPPAELARRLVAKGVSGVVMGQGAAGLIVADGTGARALEALAVPVVDVTGAGDCLAAATLAACLAGLDLAAASRIGRLAAALAVGSDEAVPRNFGIPALRDLALRLDSAAHAQLARF